MPPLRPGKVYHLPRAGQVPNNSIAHRQKRQNSFFNHPVLVVASDEQWTHFYALTTTPSTAIIELKMGFRIGPHSPDDNAPEVLELAPGSNPMCLPSWVNLEQRFKIETRYLWPWTIHVEVGASELKKIDARIVQLEALQNRYIYKPLERDLRGIAEGTVMMLKNNKPTSGTFGAPILIVENSHPRMQFFRIKKVSDNPALSLPLDQSPVSVERRRLCLLLGNEGDVGHDGSPVLLVRPGCQTMREASYLELAGGTKAAMFDQCSTWCWPSIVLREDSMRALHDWCARLESTGAGWRSTTAWDDLNASRRRWSPYQAKGQGPTIPKLPYYGHGQQLLHENLMPENSYSNGYSQETRLSWYPDLLQSYPFHDGYIAETQSQREPDPYEQYYLYPNNFGNRNHRFQGNSQDDQREANFQGMNG